MNAIAVALKCNVAAQWRGIQDGYSGHVAQYLKTVNGRDPADYATVLGYFRELDGSAYRRGTVRAKRVAIKARLRYTARALDPA